MVDRQRTDAVPGAWMFALSFSLLICHELDAMIRREWELLPGLSGLSEDVAADVFTLLHIPLFAVPLWLLTSGSAAARRRTIVVVEALAVAHALAHALLRGAEAYRFEPPVETVTVFGAALVGALHLVVMRRGSEPTRSVVVS
ncbi:MAG: DUF6713 family protein [Actinomycetota bacterium]